MTVRRHPAWALYAALAVLFVIATAYQVRALKQIFPEWFGANFVQWPFLLETEDQPHFSVEFVRQDARASGLQNGDVLILVMRCSV